MPGAAMIIIVLAVGWLSLHFTQETYLPLKQNGLITNYAISAVITYETGNKLALAQWFEELNRHSKVQAYLIDENGNEVLERNLSGPLERLRKNSTNHQLPLSAFRDRNIIVSRLIKGSNNHQYRLLAEKKVPFDFFAYFAAVKGSTLIYGFLIAFIITGLICYFLSRYLTHPLRLLAILVRRLAEGDLSVRVGTSLAERRDEISELASEFDSMAEKIEQLVITQKRLLQDVSHELRSPLARLQVALELARNNSHDYATKELDRIELEANRLNELIGQILSFARMEANEYKLNKAEFNFPDLFRDLVQDLAYEDSALAKRIKLFVPVNFIIIADEKLLPCQNSILLNF
jgi:two-component system sensor histidine kinase CpxA